LLSRTRDRPFECTSPNKHSSKEECIQTHSSLEEFSLLFGRVIDHLNTLLFGGEIDNLNAPPLWRRDRPFEYAPLWRSHGPFELTPLWRSVPLFERGYKTRRDRK